MGQRRAEDIISPCGVFALFRFNTSGRFMKLIQPFWARPALLAAASPDVVRHVIPIASALSRWWRVKCRPWRSSARSSRRYAVMDDTSSAEQLVIMLQQHGSRTEVLSGQRVACEMAALDEVGHVMAAIVGAAGLLPTPRSRRAGKTPISAGE